MPGELALFVVTKTVVIVKVTRAQLLLRWTRMLHKSNSEIWGQFTGKIRQDKHASGVVNRTMLITKVFGRRFFCRRHCGPQLV